MNAALSFSLPGWPFVALYLVAAVGATIVLTQGRIARFVRRAWPELLGCPMCSGFWVGCATMLALVIRGAVHPVLRVAMDMVACGFSISLAAFSVYLVMNILGSDYLDHGCTSKCPEHKE